MASFGNYSTTSSIAQPEPLQRKGNPAENWNKWKQSFQIYLIASGNDDKDNKRACALFFHIIGQYGRDVGNELEIDFTDEGTNLDFLYSKFENYFNPKSSLILNRYQFFNTKQTKQQPFDTFLRSLKQKSKNCEFGDLADSFLMTQLISGISNIKVQERLLRLPDLDLDAVVQECRTSEMVENQTQQLGANANTGAQPKNHNRPNKVKSDYKQSDHKIKNPTEGEKGKINNCKFCGNSHAYGNCPAFNTTCKKCNKPNHSAKVCKNRESNSREFEKGNPKKSEKAQVNFCTFCGAIEGHCKCAMAQIVMPLISGASAYLFKNNS